MKNYDPLVGLEDRARAALETLGLHPGQKREAWQAFREHPEGVERIAERARRDEAANPELRAAALFLTDLRAGRHRASADPGPRKTGWRWVHGSHSGTYVEDPEGTDPLPFGYDLATKASEGEHGWEPATLDYSEWSG